MTFDGAAHARAGIMWTSQKQNMAGVDGSSQNACRRIFYRSDVDV